MTTQNLHLELTTYEISEIKMLAAEKLGACRKTYDVIGEQIFSILKLNARVIFYAMGDKGPWGFTRINSSSAQIKRNKPFVAINTSLPLDCQAFAVAHELYHIWFTTTSEIIPNYILSDSIVDKNELKANRFAAEFLVDENLLRQEMKIHNIDKTNINLKDILKLSELFLFPYKAMVKRLHELDIITKKEADKFLLISDEALAKKRNLYSIYQPIPDNRISIDNLIELAVTKYEQKLITFEKLEYLLSLEKLTMSDVGISEESNYQFPTDEELDDILKD